MVTNSKMAKVTMRLEVNMVVESAKKVVNDSKVVNKTNVVNNDMVIDNAKLVEVTMILVVTMEVASYTLLCCINGHQDLVAGSLPLAQHLPYWLPSPQPLLPLSTAPPTSDFPSLVKPIENYP